MNLMRITYIALASCLSPLLLEAQLWNLLLTASQEPSLNSTTGSAGFATVELTGSTLEWSVRYEGTGALTGAHFHGPAGPGVNAGVQVSVGTAASPIVGSTTLTGPQVTDLLAGQWYLNLHTGTNPGGELRGQVVSQLSFTPNMILSGSQEVSPVTTTAGGGAALVTYNTSTNVVSWNVAYEGLSGTVTASHFHGAALAGVNAGVQVTLNPTTGTTFGSFSGSQVISAGQASDLLAGLWYINLHTTANGGGELRGQVTPVVVPEPGSFALLAGLLVICMCFVRRIRRP